MKKLFVAVALVMGVGTTVAFAADNQTTAASVAVAVNDFVPVEVDDLPQAVKDTLAKDYADYMVKEAAVEANEDGTQTYKVTLTAQDDTEQTVLLSEKWRSAEIMNLVSDTIRMGYAARYTPLFCLIVSERVLFSR